MAEYGQRRRDLRAYGMLNFGDWWGERGRNWGNIEYDTQHIFSLHALRSGDLDFFYRGREAARHNRDVDTIWYSDDPNRIGCVYAHCIGHTGDYYTHKINDQGSPRGGARLFNAGGQLVHQVAWDPQHCDALYWPEAEVPAGGEGVWRVERANTCRHSPLKLEGIPPYLSADPDPCIRLPAIEAKAE